jgi:hypothetical protein
LPWLEPTDSSITVAIASTIIVEFVIAIEYFGIVATKSSYQTSLTQLRVHQIKRNWYQSYGWLKDKME